MFSMVLLHFAIVPIYYSCFQKFVHSPQSSTFIQKFLNKNFFCFITSETYKFYIKIRSSSLFVCDLLVQGAPLMKKVWKFTEEGSIPQTCICVHPLYCLHHKKPWQPMHGVTLVNRCIPVASVTSVPHLTTPFVCTRISTRVNTSAPNVANVFKAPVRWHYTGKVIRKRSRLNVLFATNGSKRRVHWLHTAEFTVETIRTNVACVTRCLVGLDI